MNKLLSSMFAYDKTFDPELVLGHCDLISRFSDFALYLDTQLVYFQIMPYISTLSWYFFILLSDYE